MIGKYEGPRTDTGFYAVPRPRHRAVSTSPTILATRTLPWRTRARLFLITALWHARHGGITAVLNPPRWRTWREDVALAAVAVGVTAVVVPLVVWAIEAAR